MIESALSDRKHNSNWLKYLVTATTEHFVKNFNGVVLHANDNELHLVEPVTSRKEAK